jgi:hypothetical protein
MNTQIDTNTLMLEFFKSMTNVDRLKIIGALATEKLTLEELAARLSLPASTVSHHIDNLVELGLIRIDSQHYHLDTHTVEAMARQTLAQQRKQAKAEDFDGEAYDRKVLADFFTPQGQLKALPVQNKKLLVVLRYLVNKEFEPGVRFSEKEVNTKLSAYFDDTASLRRYMVDNRYLEREKGIYWKPESLNP